MFFFGVSHSRLLSCCRRTSKQLRLLNAALVRPFPYRDRIQVTHTFKEFRRTHQDKWQESHRARFTREQLDTFDDVLGGAHSYFI